MTEFVDNMTSRVGYWLRKAGIKITRQKRFYSFRDRAIDKMKRACVPADIRHSITGHALERTVQNAERFYGDGFSMEQKNTAMQAIWCDLDLT